MRRRNLQSITSRQIFLLIFTVLAVTLFCLLFTPHFKVSVAPKVSAANTDSEIEDALFARQEFFGEQAFVARPTTEARDNLARLVAAAPGNLPLAEKLAALDEKLEKFNEAESILIRLSEADVTRLENLAAFYQRRAEFEKEAVILEKVLYQAAPEKRAAAFENLVEASRIHDLKQYLTDDFYAKVIKENQNFYPVFEKVIDNLTKEKNYDLALNLLRQAKVQFSDKKNELLEREIEILLEIKKIDEAEKVYQAAFDPFWSEDQSKKFYDFLDEHNRLRLYGAEIKKRFRKTPADFDAAVRYALYRNHDYKYGNDDVTPIFTKLESAKKSWTTGELVIITRLLLKSGDAQAASRFLYTLYLREDFQKNKELRARILYQLFEVFSDAEGEKLPLTKGNLKFYEDVARADTNPGIATGILSLVFSDTAPGLQLEDQETKANVFFNRAAAYRIFEEYKKENPNSPELAQMYLDIVRLYAATSAPEVAERTLAEFAEVYQSSNDYPAAALKLGEAFKAAKQEEKAREVYQKTLDYLGNQSAPASPERPKSEAIVITGFSTQSKKEIIPDRNAGINIPGEKKKVDYEYNYYEKPSKFHDYLKRESAPVTYAEVLESLIASFAKEKKTPEILAVYSNEIAKYPNAEWLYEKRLNWLEQTNLTEEKLRVYKAAFTHFQSVSWRDKLTRFFLRENRRSEFAEFADSVVGQATDKDVQQFLGEFVSGKISTSDFDKQLYLKLYAAAHERFPHNLAFVNGLLNFYQSNNQLAEWRKLASRYYFELPEIRNKFLANLARQEDLRNHLERAKSSDSTIYELFRADASVYLSEYENAVNAYRKINQIYPHEPVFEERLITLTRSLGQKNRNDLSEAAHLSEMQANYELSNAEYRTRGGEIRAELGDYEAARANWNHLVKIGRGDREVYTNAATVFWDYFQYDDALRMIKSAREKFADDTLYAFETGAIYESQHKPSEAVSEYVKAFGSNDDTQKEKSKRRLVRLTENRSDQFDDFIAADKFAEEKSRRSAFENLVAASYAKEFSKKNNANLALGYAQYLAEIKRADRIEEVLNSSIKQSANKDFLEETREFYQVQKMQSGERIALIRLGEIIRNPREKIAYRLQLTQSFAATNERNSALKILQGLVQQFPTNYGVLTEVADFLNRLGFGEESVRILQNALPKARGAYRGKIAAHLTERLIALNHLGDAERILDEFHAENPSDEEIFRELVRVCVRTGNFALMRKAFTETVTALKETGADRRELEDKIIELRTEMIDAFTRLKDYKSAIEQHIEIINHDPADEAKVEAAILYVQRYGAAQTLIDYYLKASAEAFKNYRWNVVLARIYIANGDWENAAKNYQTAIVNQPEIPELYLALADVEIKRGDTDKALKNLDEVLTLTNDSPEYVKKKIEILKRAGRLAEAETEKAKLPAEVKKKTEQNEFDEARKLAATEKEKARHLYRDAFDKLLENPLSGEMKAADLSGYVAAIREEEPLDQIAVRLWHLRENLVAVAEKDNSINAAEARRRVETLDGAIVESIGKLAGDFGTDEELRQLHEDWQNRLEKTPANFSNYQLLSVIQNLARRAKFGDLEELILLKKIDEVNLEERQAVLRNLVDFYNARGAYQKSFDALEKYESSDLILKGEAAKLVGNREKELEALRGIYWKTFEKPIAGTNENVARYLEIIYAEKAEELKSLTEKNSSYQFQLINFLLAKGESQLAHQAIKNSQFSPAWKAARNAETSLALREFSDTAECYFCEALQFDTIGKLIHQTPDKKGFLINDDWFRLTKEYGEWLHEKHDAQLAPEEFLPAITENLPNSADEQAKLGIFYLDRNENLKAIEHFRLALELDSGKLAYRTLLGVAYEKIGRGDYAEECWSKVFSNDSVDSGAEFFQALGKYGLAKIGREKVVPLLVKFLQDNDADRSEGFQNLIRSIAASFTNESEKSIYFLQILKLRPSDTSLAAMLTSEDLIAKFEQQKFYELLIARGGNVDYYDYEFKSVLERVWSKDDAEAAYAQETNYRAEEPENEAFKWRCKYLELLLELKENVKATTYAAQIEKELNNRYVRPNWLRLAEIRLQVRAGKYNAVNAETFIGIRVPDAATEITPPNLERFNALLHILREENEDVTAIDLSEKFFARQLALEQFSATNFSGFARALFQKNETEKALQIVRLMIQSSDEGKRETALAEILNFAEIKAQTAALAKVSSNQSTDFLHFTAALEIAAEMAAEFQLMRAAIEFRHKLAEASPADYSNKIELTKLLLKSSEKQEAFNLLSQIESDQNVPRIKRWQAREMLIEASVQTYFPIITFDPYSQFYNGKFTAQSGENENARIFFVNSLINSPDCEISNFARQELMKYYARSGKFFAALKLAETDSSDKSDELLEMLSQAAEKISDFLTAIEYEKQRQVPDKNRVFNLQTLLERKNQTATDFRVDAENTRNL